jgi:serine/threonine protein kinase
MLQRIGAGTFGEVWKAEAPGGTEVAVKIIRRPFDAREAQQELEALEHVKRLRHPYLVQTQAFWVVQDRVHIVLELADTSLKDLAAQRRQKGQDALPAADLLRYFGEAAEALDFLYDNGMHHRDIKPANILVLGGHAKLADFGLARPLPANISLADVTTSGTPAYMPPEVWHGRTSRHSDQWSLAATYAELRLGRPLLGGLDLPTVMARRVMGDIDLSPLPAAEQQVLRKALATDTHGRYGSCREFVRELEQAMEADFGGHRLWRRLLHVVFGAGAVLGLILLAALPAR